MWRLLEKSAAPAAVLLVLIASARIVSTYTVFNHTIDEPDNLAPGMEWLDAGKYLYEDAHPPLARVFGALGPFLAGERWRPGPDSYLEGYRILGRGRHYDRTLALGRAGILPFFWLGSLVVFLWGRRAGGPVAAVTSTLVFTTIPPILAHAGLITTDMAVAACVPAAGFASLLWAERPSRARTLWLGAAVALALLSKFSALVFLPAGWLLMYACYLVRARPGVRQAARQIWDRRGSIAMAAGVACLLIWAGYRFTFARVEFLHCRLPAPRFFSGIHSVWLHNRAGHPSYLLGRRSNAGFWYYFPVVLALKTPLAMLALVAAALWAGLRKGEAWLYPAMFSCGILLCAMAGRIDIGVRHILPLYAGLAVVCGVTAAPMLDRRAARWALGALLVWQVTSGALQHPDYLAYTNEIAGTHPENFVADSDLDWGQDMKRLGDYLRRVGATEVTFAPFHRTYPALAGHPFPRMLPGEADHPSVGWNAVSVTVWKVFGYPTWPDGREPQARIGRSILLWYVPL